MLELLLDLVVISILRLASEKLSKEAREEELRPDHHRSKSDEEIRAIGD